MSNHRVMSEQQLRKVIRECVRQSEYDQWRIFNEARLRVRLMNQRHHRHRKNTLNEEWSTSDIGHTILDIGGLAGDAALVAGLPIGTVIDTANAVWYATEKNFLLAGLSLVSALPVIGDVIGKGGKVGMWLAKTAKGSGKIAPKAATAVLTAKNTLAKHWPKAKALLDAAKDHPLLGKYIPQMTDALSTWMADKSPKGAALIQTAGELLDLEPSTAGKLNLDDPIGTGLSAFARAETRQALRKQARSGRELSVADLKAAQAKEEMA